MWIPHHVDGRSVVILRQGIIGFRVIERGVLSYDGEELILQSDDHCRSVSDQELDSLLPVSESSHIPECKGFDFFLIVM